MTFILGGGTKTFKNRRHTFGATMEIILFRWNNRQTDHNPPFDKISDELYNIHLPLSEQVHMQFIHRHTMRFLQQIF